jgi:hypothetical protein
MRDRRLQTRSVHAMLLARRGARATRAAIGHVKPTLIQIAYCHFLGLGCTRARRQARRSLRHALTLLHAPRVEDRLVSSPAYESRDVAASLEQRRLSWPREISQEEWAPLLQAGSSRMKSMRAAGDVSRRMLSGVGVAWVRRSSCASVRGPRQVREREGAAASCILPCILPRYRRRAVRMYSRRPAGDFAALEPPAARKPIEPAAGHRASCWPQSQQARPNAQHQMLPSWANLPSTAAAKAIRSMRV